MAAGKPFISTAVGGVLDLAKGPLTQVSTDCRQAANGFLTATNPDVMVACLEKLKCSPELAKQMGKEGQALAFANYDQGRLACDLSELYEKLLKHAKIPERAKTIASPVERNAHN